MKINCKEKKIIGVAKFDDILNRNTVERQMPTINN